MSWRPSAALVAAEGTAVACFGGAMALYPGGAEHAPGARGHSFWLNYLCDLTDAQARSGAVNDGALLARLGMAALVIGLAVMFAYAPRAFRSARLALFVRAVGALAVIATLGVPLSAWLGIAWLHDASVLIAGPLGLLACGAVVLGLARGEGAAVPTLLGGLTLLAATFDLIVYARCWATGTTWIVLPVAQRVALLSLLAWMLALAHHLRARAAPKDLALAARDGA
ncbi:MAG: hypothetical protein M5U28_49985 [Sandaracinaceae bacterium]|nr:hypothetical protein [Sandaracinaceae bacterium]